MTTVGQKRYITVGYITRTVVIAVNDSLGLTDNTTASPTSGAIGGWIYGANGTYKPGATTSGVPSGTTLTTHTGSYAVTTSGTFISAMHVTGGIDIETSNVIVSQCLVNGHAANGDCVVDCRHSGCVNALVEDCEIQPLIITTSTNSAMGHDVTWQRCKVHGGTDGIRSATNNLSGGVQANGRANAYLLGNYVYGLAGWLVDPSHGNGPSHCDPWQPEGGNYNVAIGNNFQGFIDSTLGQGTATSANWNGGNHVIVGSTTTNSCIQFNTNTAKQTTGCVVNNNWMNGGYIAINVSLGAGNQVDSISNNLFGHGTTGNLQINLLSTANPTRTGNAFDDGVGTIAVHLT
ncbi:MAG TPA: hypothetical protein VGL75_00935 [Acidothermaceae bacterium]